MLSDFAILNELDFGKFVTIFLILILLITPGFLVIFFWEKTLLIQINIFKLIFLSIAFSSPLYIINFFIAFIFLYNVHFNFDLFKDISSEEEKNLKKVVLSCIFNSGRDTFLVFSLSLWISYFFKFTPTTFIKYLVIIDIIIYFLDIFIIPAIVYNKQLK